MIIKYQNLVSSCWSLHSRNVLRVVRYWGNARNRIWLRSVHLTLRLLYEYDRSFFIFIDCDNHSFVISNIAKWKKNFKIKLWININHYMHIHTFNVKLSIHYCINITRFNRNETKTPRLGCKIMKTWCYLLRHSVKTVKGVLIFDNWCSSGRIECSQKSFYLKLCCSLFYLMFIELFIYLKFILSINFAAEGKLI